MKKAPLISIQTPVYNQAQYFKETINSVLSQTYENWEWVIIDDGSTDHTRDIIHSFGDKRIRYYFQHNTGIDRICALHNKAFALSRGEFIALIDGDDIWPNYKLEHQIGILTQNDAALSYGECCLIDSHGKEIDYAKIPEDRSIAENLPVGASLYEFFLKANSFIFNPTVVVRKVALEKIGGFIMFTGLSQDFPTWSTLAMKERFSPLHECLGYWRKHRKSLTFHNAKYRFLNKLKFIKQMAELQGEQFSLPGFKCSKSDILTANEKRLHEFLNNFSYDRAMLMASLRMFKEAESEFMRYLSTNYTVKNRFINKLFSASTLLNVDLVNPLRRIKEKVSIKKFSDIHK